MEPSAASQTRLRRAITIKVYWMIPVLQRDVQLVATRFAHLCFVWLDVKIPEPGLAVLMASGDTLRCHAHRIDCGGVIEEDGLGIGPWRSRRPLPSVHFRVRSMSGSRSPRCRRPRSPQDVGGSTFSPPEWSANNDGNFTLRLHARIEQRLQETQRWWSVDKGLETLGERCP